MTWKRIATALLSGAITAGALLLLAAFISSAGTGIARPGNYSDAWRMYWAGAALLTLAVAVIVGLVE